ncbi:hypothetical protein ACHAXT_003551 [Thalassiosira profunda]
MIYLEDIEGALRHDSLSPPPQDALGEYLSPELYPEGEVYPYRWGTPGHYLTHPPSPAASPVALDVGENDTTVLGNGTIEEGLGNATNTNSTADGAPDGAANSSLFDRRRLQSGPNGLIQEAMHQNPSADEGPLHEEGMPTPDPTSVIPEITGEATAPFPQPDPTSNADPMYFDDLELIAHPTFNYVYYDSKQAHFGVDLGPRGNAEYVNMMLPPRWDWDWWAKLDASWRKEVEEATPVKEQDAVGGNVTSGDATNDTSSSTEGEQQSAAIQTGPASEASSRPSSMPSTLPDAETDRIRRLQSIDELLGLEHFGGDEPVGNKTDTGVAQGSTEPPSVQYHVSDYFCRNDFLQWRQHERNASSADDSDASSAMNNATRSLAETPDVPGEDSSGVQSTRPLTILVRRGRCSFESKARLAMMLNELLADEGLANRIGHLVVYNNGTVNPATENDSGESTVSNGEQEKLVDMTRESTLNKGGEITVGMLYVATQSGEDLLRRMRAQAETTGISAHVDVSMLFQDDASDEGQTAANGQSERKGRASDRRRLANGAADGSTKDDGDYQILDSEHDAVYDPRITNGWFYPATMTRFCLSCGRGMHYGLVWPDDGSKGPQTDGNGLGPGAEEGTPGGGVELPPLRPPIQWPTRYGTVDYQRPYLEVIRKLMIAVLVLLLVGPMLLAARRWRTVGGTFRITRDEHGRRRLRLLNPNLEVFVNGVPGTVENNGTKLDRAQVFNLPEIEYMGAVDPEENEHNVEEGNSALEESQGVDDSERDHDDANEQDDQNLHMSCSDSTEPSSPPGVTSMLSRDSSLSARFVSSSTCSICLDEFALGEKVRLLPRCNHAYHTECILPWLTERQGCCPMCKVPVLPEEMQRSPRHHRRSRRQRTNLLRSPRSESERHQPQSTITASSTEREDAGIVEGIQLASGVEGDLVAPPQARLDDEASGIRLVPFGTEGAVGDAESHSTDEPRIRTVSVDTEDILIATGGDRGDNTATATFDEEEGPVEPRVQR